MLSTNKDTNKNLKDSEQKLPASYGAVSQNKNMSVILSYTKTNKLITALYMVTDMIDHEEPIRNKLRTLGLEIFSDIHAQANISRIILDIGKIEQAMSFLNIASAMNFISEMNYAILKKEFLELKGSMQEYLNIKPTWLTEFLSEPPIFDKEGVEDGNSLVATSSSGFSSSKSRESSKGHLNFSIGHQSRTRIGVQKGSTLMKALSDKTYFMSNGINNERHSAMGLTSHAQDFDILKKQRRNDIIEIIKNNGGSATIKDIRTNTTVQGRALHSTSEKTLQRELLSMTKDGVLDKKGSKRWTHYFMKNQT